MDLVVDIEEEPPSNRSDNGSFYVPEDHIGYPVQPWLTATETDDQQPFLN